MKLTYGITYEDFRSLFPSAAKLRKPKPALYFGMVMAALLALVGVLITLKALDIVDYRTVPEGTTAQGLGTIFFGIAIIGLCVWYERRTDATIRRKYESHLAAKFKNLHCSNNRTIECSPESLEISCACGSTSRPWTEVSAFTEGPAFFQINTRQEAHLIPKRAFASESERTEFRALVDEHVHVASALSGTRIQFVRTKADARKTRMLHMKKGLSSKQKVNIALSCAVLVWAVFYGIRAVTGNPHYAVGLGVCALSLAARFSPWIKKSKYRYFGRLNASFNADGIQIQDNVSTARYRWTDFRGYTKDSSYWLLYHTNNTYRAFPRRAFQLNQASEFNQLLEKNLKPITSSAR